MSRVPDFVAKLFASDPLMERREVRTRGSTMLVGLHEEGLSKEGRAPPTMTEAEKELWDLRQAVGLLVERHCIQLTPAQRQFVVAASPSDLRKICTHLGEHHAWPEEWTPVESTTNTQLR